MENDKFKSSIKHHNGDMQKPDFVILYDSLAEQICHMENNVYEIILRINMFKDSAIDHLPAKETEVMPPVKPSVTSDLQGYIGKLKIINDKAVSIKIALISLVG